MASLSSVGPSVRVTVPVAYRRPRVRSVFSKREVGGAPFPPTRRGWVGLRPPARRLWVRIRPDRTKAVGFDQVLHSGATDERPEPTVGSCGTILYRHVRSHAGPAFGIGSPVFLLVLVLFFLLVNDRNSFFFLLIGPKVADSL